MNSAGPPTALTVLYTNIASPAAKPPASTSYHPPNGAPVATRPSTTTKTAIAVMAATTMARTALAMEVVVALLARPPPHYFRRQDQRTVADLWPPMAGAHDYVPRHCAHWIAASVGLRGNTGPLRVSQPPIRAIAVAAVPVGRPDPKMEPLARCQQSLANSFITMALHPPPTSVQDWVADSGATHHTTLSAGNISTLHPLASSNPSSIIVGNGSSLPITSVGDSVLPGPFYLNNIFLAPNMVQSLISVRRFTTDNWCSMEFDPFGLSVKDLTTKNMIVSSNSTGPLYTMRLPGSLTPSSSAMATLTTVPHALTVVAPTMWHRCLGHPGPNALSSLLWSSFIQCTSKKHDFCHACQLGKHTRLPFCSSSHHAEHPFDLIHLVLWTSPVVSVSGSKYYLVILDDFTHYL
jgi:hypothetical protein